MKNSNVPPNDEVTAEHAALEGEGDMSLAQRRKAHWEFFSRECERIGRIPDLRMPIECCAFEVVG